MACADPTAASAIILQSPLLATFTEVTCAFCDGSQFVRRVLSIAYYMPFFVSLIVLGLALPRLTRPVITLVGLSVTIILLFHSGLTHAFGSASGHPCLEHPFPSAASFQFSGVYTGGLILAWYYDQEEAAVTPFKLTMVSWFVLAGILADVVLLLASPRQAAWSAWAGALTGAILAHAVIFIEPTADAYWQRLEKWWQSDSQARRRLVAVAT